MQNGAEMRSDRAAVILIEKMVRDMYQSKASSEIQPLQWSILRYLERTPEPRRTMSWVTSFLGLTHAPVVRAINTLVRRGLVEQQPNPTDARSNILSLTVIGLNTLANDPILGVVRRMSNLPDGEREQFRKTVRTLAMDLNNEEVGAGENSSTD